MNAEPASRGDRPTSEASNRARVAAAVMVCAASLPAAEGLMITLKAAFACK